MVLFQHIVLSIFLSVWILGVIFAIRNCFVQPFHQIMLNKLIDLCDEDARYFKSYGWRFKEFNSIVYWKMVIYFWKPLKPFYKDLRCLKGDVNEKT